MKKTLLPYLYNVEGTLVFKRVKFIDDNIITKVRIYYKLDSFTYKKISIEFDTSEYTLQQIITVITLTINNLNKKFR